MVWKLDRLARSMKQLIETVENLQVKGIGFRSLTEALDTTNRARAGAIHSRTFTGTSSSYASHGLVGARRG